MQVDPIKINHITEFTSPEGLAKLVEKVERDKDGVIDVNIIQVNSFLPNRISSVPTDKTTSLDDPMYELEYIVDSSRGLNHYTVAAGVRDKKLLVLTVQYREVDSAKLRDIAAAVVHSISLSP